MGNATRPSQPINTKVVAFTRLFARIHPATAHHGYLGQTTSTKPCFGQFPTQSQSCRQYYAQLAATTASTAATLPALFGCRHSDLTSWLAGLRWPRLSSSSGLMWGSCSGFFQILLLPCHRNCFTRQPKTAKCLTRVIPTWNQSP